MLFHLLPESEKKAMMREYSYRKAVVAGSFALVLFVLAAALLLPSYFLSATKEQAVIGQIDILKENNVLKKSTDYGAALAEAKRRIAALEPSAKISVEEVFSLALSKRSSAIRLNGFFFDRGILRLTGTALDRESLVTFARDLRLVPLFEKVEFPISNFAKDRDIDFVISINGAF